MNDLRAAAQQALEAMEKATRFMSDKDYRKLNESIEVLRTALAEPVQELERRRLTDAEIGEVWFAAKIPGLTETSARLLIRAAERRLAGEA